MSRKGTRRNTPWLIKHGGSRSRTYAVWVAMKQRCLNRRCASWANYGGRGIFVCDRWMFYSNFIADMGHPQPGHTLERIDNSDGYHPANCKWAKRDEQQNNIRTNRLLTVDGTTKTTRQWEKDLGYRRGTIATRLRYGWSEAEAVKTPPVPGNKPHHRVSS